jgi:hypothetical protein
MDHKMTSTINRHSLKREWNLERPVPQRRRSDRQSESNESKNNIQAIRSDYDSDDVMVRLKTMFYKVILSGDFVVIESTGVHGASGRLRFHKDVDNAVFSFYGRNLIPDFGQPPKEPLLTDGTGYTCGADQDASEVGSSRESALDFWSVEKNEKNQMELHVTGASGSTGCLSFGFPELASLQWKAFQKTKASVDQLMEELRHTTGESSTSTSALAKTNGASASSDDPVALINSRRTA